MTNREKFEKNVTDIFAFYSQMTPENNKFDWTKLFEGMEELTEKNREAHFFINHMTLIDGEGDNLPISVCAMASDYWWQNDDDFAYRLGFSLSWEGGSADIPLYISPLNFDPNADCDKLTRAIATMVKTILDTPPLLNLMLDSIPPQAKAESRRIEGAEWADKYFGRHIKSLATSSGE